MYAADSEDALVELAQKGGSFMEVPSLRLVEQG